MSRVFEQPVLRVLLCAAAGAVLLYSLYRAALCFSAKRQHDAVRAMQRYFYENAKKPRRAQAACPPQWVERGAEELESPYFLRTGQQVSFLASMGRERNWYGLEAWVRDMVASRGSLSDLAETGEKPEDGGDDGG